MRVRVLGAGIVGLSVAEELLRRGHDVETVDPAPGSGASYAAAGMLTPAGELWHGEDALYDLGRRSTALWPAFADRLGVPLHTGGTLLVASDRGDLQVLERQLALVAAHDQSAQELTRRELLAVEPRLGRMLGGALLPDDHSIDPRAVVAALLNRVEVRPEPSATAVDATVLATGTTLPTPFDGWVRPVRGEILRLRLPADELPDRTIRAWVAGESVYLVPRESAELVVGATQEEHDEPPVVTAGGVWRLLDTARRVVPGVDRAELVEVTARDRPGTVDNAPLVGPTDDPSVLLAAGHFRHGVLLAPLTAQLIADHLETGRVEPAFDPRRVTR